MTVEVSTRRARARLERLGLEALALGTERLLDGLGLVDGLDVTLVVVEVVVAIFVVIVVVIVEIVVGVGIRVSGSGIRPARGLRLGLDDLDPLGADALVDVVELVAVDVDLLQGELDIVLAHASVLGISDKVLNDLLELVGKLDLVFGLPRISLRRMNFLILPKNQG